MAPDNLKKMYSTKSTGDFPESASFLDQEYEKIEDLRYGTNPHQPAAFYRRKGSRGPLASMKILKSGKQGMSQTNLEDVSQALGILRFMDQSSCAVMKHVNPSGVASAKSGESLGSVYSRARDADPQAAFGSVVVFNRPLDSGAAEEIMQTIVEVVAAPQIPSEALEILRDGSRFGKNKQIRVLEIPGVENLEKWDQEIIGQDFKVLVDGSVVVAQKFGSKLKSIEDLIPASTTKKDGTEVRSDVKVDTKILEDLRFAWYVTAGVRSNGVVVAEGLETLAVGTGQQDRVTAVMLALDKVQSKYKGRGELKGSVLASDGFFPFPDSIDLMGRAGIAACVSPGGSVRDWEILETANKIGMAMFFTGERCFSHH